MSKKRSKLREAQSRWAFVRRQCALVEAHMKRLTTDGLMTPAELNQVVYHLGKVRTRNDKQWEGDKLESNPS